MRTLNEAGRKLLDRFARGSDLRVAEATVAMAVKAPMTDNQYAAVLSFAQDVGSISFRGSRLLRELNSGAYDSAARYFLLHDRQAGHAVFPRRAAERMLFTSP